MSVSTLNLAPALAFDVVEAFDGDDVHGTRVRSLAAVLSVAPLSTREMMTWVKVTTGTELSQKTVDRSHAVAKALVTADGFTFDGDAGLTANVAANLVRIRTASPKHGGGQDGLKLAVSVWSGDLAAFCDDVAGYWETVQENRRSPEDAATPEVESVEDDTEPTPGAGEPDDGAVGGGESSVMSAERAAVILREIAGNVEAGRMAPTDDLIGAAQAILAAAATALASVDSIVVTDNTGALALA